MIFKFITHLSISAIIMIALIDNSYSQINLVPNPSFEIITSCPNNYSQIDSAVGWSSLINGGGGTPDLYHVCCTFPFVCGIPYNYDNFGFQYPKSGNAYTGIEVISTFQTREYIQTKLLKKLSAGNLYCIKFYCNLYDKSAAHIVHLGAYLDDGNVSAPSLYGLATATPQIFNINQPLSDTLNWMKVEGSFIANGSEEFITIGNFFNDSLSGLGFHYSAQTWFAYYYIDDISVIPTNLPPYAGNDTLIHPGDSVFIGRQPEIGLDEDCIWFVNGVPIDTLAGLWVQPDTTTTYVVQQTICGNVKWDTVRVSVYGTGISEGTHGLTRGLKVYPNPATNLLTIESPVTNATLSISNLLGQEVLRQPINDKVSEIDISKLGKGVYFVRVESRNGFVVKRFLKK